MKIQKGLFITGTDTGVGKTLVSALLMKVLSRYVRAHYFKPVQTGYLEDDDTTTVQKLAELKPDQLIQPIYRLKAPMSPNRAAALEGVDISLDQVYASFLSLSSEFLVVEGAGGLQVPLSGKVRIVDMAQKISLPVVIVASTRLGTINHTLLTYQSALQKGLDVLGVVLSGPKDEGLQEALQEQGVRVLFSIPELKTGSDWLAVEKVVEDVKGVLLSSVVEPNWSELDRQYIWHPFTQHKSQDNHSLVTRAEGAHFYLENHKKVVDGISSWWVNVLGHSRPEIAEAIAQQAQNLEHVIFAGFTHKPAVQLSERIIQKLRLRYSNIQKVFFSDNGSTSVEVALKMSYQYFALKGETQRKKFMALRGGYHGDTLGAMSVGEPEGFHTYFKPLMMPVDYMTPDSLSELELFEKSADQYAACIIEPLIQGAGGMRIYSVPYLQKLADICHAKGVHLICDEIFTGFYRTGHFLASDHADLQPDFICLSKGLTGGFLPLSLTVTTQKIFDAFCGDKLQTAFLHGHSYTGNPLACAAAVASLDLLENADVQRRIQSLSQWTKEEINKLKGLEGVSRPRCLGTIGAFDVQGKQGYFDGDFAQRFSQLCLEQNIFVKPLGGTVYTVPPYCIEENEFRRMYSVITKTLKTVREL